MFILKKMIWQIDTKNEEKITTIIIEGGFIYVKIH